LECGIWGSLKEENSLLIDKKDELVVYPTADLTDLNAFSGHNLARFSSGLPELDRVLGGGIVEGSLVLFGGEPGIGKSTIMSQMALHISLKSDLLYVSGEESALQVKHRLERLGKIPENFKFSSEPILEKIISALIKFRPKAVIIDSIQTIHSLEVDGESGSINQIKAATVKLLEIAKANNIAVFLVGHVTKDGQLSGPKSLEHIVDTVIYLEGDNNRGHSILRSFKNRFGASGELGILKMTDNGFETARDGSWLFMDQDDNSESLPGSAVGCALEGSRVFIIDIQSLVSKTIFGYPQRKSSGYDLNRLGVLAAVLSKRQKINLATSDVILNVVGGFRVSDPGLDLAVCAAIASSFFDKALDKKTIFIGEVGLSGELRSVKNIELRIKEAERLGFKNAYIPQMDLAKIKKTKLKIIGITSLKDFLVTLGK
jgi:DNA repair protein RadA/Sms